MASGSTQIGIVDRRGYATAAQVARLLRVLRVEGINPSSFKFGADGSILFSATPIAGETPTDFDVWEAAGKL